MTLTPEHERYLVAHAVTPAVIETAGLWSVTTADELPPAFRWYGEAAVPSIVFPWCSPLGTEVLQLKPDTPIEIDGEEKPRKYLLAKGAPSVLNAVMPDGDTVLIIEGTKQHLAAAGYSPPKTAVFGLMGCAQWMDDNVPIADLCVVEGKPVVVCFDADLSSNPDVWSQADRLKAALKAEGAAEVRFVKLPAGGSAGLDDVLARRDLERRHGYLARLIDNSTAQLPARPRPRRKERKRIAPKDGRLRIVITNDQKTVIDEITDVLVQRWSGSELFNHGDVIARRLGHVIKPLDRGAFLDTLQEAAVTVLETEEGDVYSWPHLNCILAALTRAERYAPLHRITRAPFVRPDGTICQAPGYDVETGTYLLTDVAVDVPELPAEDQVQAAADLILRDWLADMPFATGADRANVLALCITAVIRGLVDLVPLAVIDGLQMGVGKNLLADCIAILATGDVIDPLPYSSDNEEMRKLITSVFRAGTDFIAFDEAHLLEGNALARSLTALHYTDRVLGVSTLARFPNRVTWLSMGNQVQIHGDVARRVYPISLRPTVANPELRSEDDFRHPALRTWTRNHRPELLSAVLTLVRAWFTAGCPESVRGARFGSFEAWGRMVGGIVELAGEKEFLGNVITWRSESDFETAFWGAHLRWLHETFGGNYFTCGEVRKALITDVEGAEPPPGMEDTAPKDYARLLGKRYARYRDRVFEGYQLRRSETRGHKNVTKWHVENTGPDDDHEQRENGGDGGNGGKATPPLYARAISPPSNRARVYMGEEPHPHHLHTSSAVAFDLETAGADECWSYGPGYVRLVGYSNGDGITTTTNPGPVLEEAAAGATLVGHNVFCYDLPVLAHHHGLDLATVSAIDTKLLAVLDDPPEARMKSGEIERYYSLDALGERLLGSGKTGDLKKLAKEFGGFDQIPVDDERYLEYVRGDVDLSARLADRFGPLNDYAVREHEVARLAAVMTVNGFRVDEELLAERLAAGEAVRTEMLERLAEHGLPTTKKDGKPCKAPHATQEGKAAIVAAFRALGVRLPRTKTDQPALGSAAMDHVAEKHPQARALADTVKSLFGIRTIYETVAANLHDGRVHPAIDFRQASGRWSVTKPGLTVMGKRGGRHREREIFLAEEGHVIISADLSQVDARAVAVHSQDPAYLSLFEPGMDAHAEIARRIWGDPGRREAGKALGHGFNYGEGPARIAREAGVSFDVASSFHRAMCEQFPLVVEWQRRMRELADAGQLLENGFGRRMRVTPGRSYTQAPALVGQACARDLMMEGLLRLDPSVWPMLRAVVHDEIVLSVPVDVVDDVEQEVLRALSFDWAPPGVSTTVQVVAGLVGRGRSWGAVYEKAGGEK